MKSKFLLLFLACIISGLVYGKSPSNGNLPASGSKAIAHSANTGYFANSSMMLPPISWTKVENTAAGWVYVGFEEDICNTCSGGSAHSYELENATAEYTISGTDLEVYAETWDGAGSIEIFIDGVSKGIFTQKVEPYGGAMKFASVSNLSSGVHQLKMVSVPEVGTGYVSWVGIDFIRFGDFIPGSVSGVSLNKSTTTITIPQTEQLTATVSPANATNKAVVWTTDDPAVATVSATGLVTPVAPGTANITATSVDDPGRMASCKVSVVELDLWTKADNEDPSWTYSGFTVDNCGDCYLGTAHYSTSLGSTAVYTFTGTDIEAYAETWDGGGAVEIFIDNVSKGIYQQNLPPYSGAAKIASFTGLSNAAHTIKFVTQSTNFTNVDYIRYTVMTGTPLTLVSFNGKATNNANALSWETKDEVNVKNFEIERSADGVQFKQIAVVNSKGGGIYGAEDRTPPSGNNYYRLRMVDNDGNFTPSKTILIKDILKQGTGFTIYPNPVKDKVTISPSDKSSLVKVALFDLRGNKVFAKQIVGTTEVSLGSLAKGVYIIQLINKGEVGTLKLVKE